MIRNELIEEMAEAIYMAHHKVAPSGNSPPIYINAREDTKAWSRLQALAALGIVEKHELLGTLA